MKLARILSASCLAVMLTMFTAAAGVHAGKVPPKKWVTSLCRELKKIEQDQTIDVNKLIRDINPADPEAMTKQVAKALRTQTKQLDRVAKALKKAGYPDVPGGKQMAADLNKSMAALSKSMRKTTTRMENAKGFQDFATQMESMQELVPELPSAEMPKFEKLLKKEWNRSRDCASITGPLDFG